MNKFKVQCATMALGYSVTPNHMEDALLDCLGVGRWENCLHLWANKEAMETAAVEAVTSHPTLIRCWLQHTQRLRPGTY